MLNEDVDDYITGVQALVKPKFLIFSRTGLPYLKDLCNFFYSYYQQLDFKQSLSMFFYDVKIVVC